MKKGFTLSEVLITLGIIGVIAALTIPAIMKEYRNKLYVAQLKRVYSQIEDAAKDIISDEHATSFNTTTAGVASAAPDEDFPEGKGAYYFLNKYFKTSKTGCDSTEGATQCYAPSYVPLDGANHPMRLQGYCVQTTNGATICMTRNSTNFITTVFVDVNGPVDPNIAGRDAFIFDITADGLLKDWKTSDYCGKKNYTEDTEAENDGGTGHIGDYASGCLAKVIEDGWTMKY